MKTEEKHNIKEQLQDLVAPMGYCIVSKMITDDGRKVGFMYREEPDNNHDSGWRFLSGTETQKYVDNSQNNLEVEVNLVANLDKAIISYLNEPFGTDLERIEGTDEFRKI